MGLLTFRHHGPTSALPWKPAGAVALAACTLLACREEPTAPTEAQPTTEITAALASSWTSLPDYPFDVFAPTSASITNPTTRRTKFYVIGGRNRLPGAGHVTDAVRVFDESARTWRKLAPVPVPLANSNGAVAIGNKIYVSGGFTRVMVDGQWRLQPVRSLYVYDPATNQWTRKRNMPIVTTDGFSDAHQGLLYVAASCLDETYCGAGFGLGALWRYNPATDRWTLLRSSPHRGPGPGGGVIGGKLYVISDVGELGIYDPASNQWSSGPRPFNEFCSFPAFAVRGKLFVITCTGDATLMFDPKVGSWTKVANRPSQTAGTVSRVFLNGQPRAEMVGGARPGNNWLFTP